MNEKQATRLIATAAIVTAGIIAWRHVSTTNSAPPPSAFLYPTAMFGGLALVADLGAPGLGAALAAALTVGIGFQIVGAGSVGAGSAAAGSGGATGAGRTRQPTRRSGQSSRTRRRVTPATKARRGS